MQQAAAAAVQAAADDLTERPKTGQADVLEHADGDEHIAPIAHIAIVVFDELDTSVQPFVCGPGPRVGDLLRRDVQRLHGHAIALRHEQRQRTPPAAGLDHPLAGLEIQLPADEIHLGHLCVFQGQSGVGK